jgi:hypothetical protein
VAEPGPVLFPVVVAPLVDAVTPAVAPGGDAVLPMLDAVTTPMAPVLESVMPVADRVVGPVVGPAAAPAVDAMRPFVEQVATSAAPFVQLVAPAVVPVVTPLTGVVAPMVDQVVSSVADPLAGAAQPALRSVLDPDPRYLGLRPATADVVLDRAPVAAPEAPAPAPAPEPAPTEAPAAPANGGARATRGDDDAVADTAPSFELASVDGAPAAPAPARTPFGGPARSAFPAPGAVVTMQGGSDSGQRDQRFMAVLPSSAGLPEARMTALARTPVESTLARFGGRPPVTPD